MGRHAGAPPALIGVQHPRIVPDRAKSGYCAVDCGAGLCPCCWNCRAGSLCSSWLLRRIATMQLCPKEVSATMVTARVNPY